MLTLIAEVVNNSVRALMDIFPLAQHAPPATPTPATPAK
jgi:hypothetical protein